MRYYYKDSNGSYYNFKSEHTEENLIPITEEEFNQATAPKQPTQEQLAKIEKQKRISEINARFKELDYIGIKIATGRATKEEYTKEIAEMDALAEELNRLEE